MSSKFKKQLLGWFLGIVGAVCAQVTLLLKTTELGASPELGNNYSTLPTYTQESVEVVDRITPLLRNVIELLTTAI